MKPIVHILGAVLLAVSACGMESPIGGGGGGGDDDGREPGEDPTTPAAPTLPDGATFVLATTLDVPVSALLPQPAYDVVVSIRALRENPGRAIFELLDEAGVPLLADLKRALPGALEDRVEGWINDAIAEHADLGLLDEALALAGIVVGDIELDSELSCATTSASHRIHALRFVAGGIVGEVPVDALDAVLAFEDSASLAIETDGEAATLVVGAHAFGLPLGDYAWLALEHAVLRQTGTSLRGLLGEAVDCARMAAEVADTGALGVEVGHEAELLALCETGLDLAVAKLRDRVAALNWDAIALAAGRATLVDADADGLADALVDGTWDATIDAGQGPRATPGRFVGARR